MTTNKPVALCPVSDQADSCTYEDCPDYQNCLARAHPQVMDVPKAVEDILLQHGVRALASQIFSEIERCPTAIGGCDDNETYYLVSRKALEALKKKYLEGVNEDYMVAMLKQLHKYQLIMADLERQMLHVNTYKAIISKEI